MMKKVSRNTTAKKVVEELLMKSTNAMSHTEIQTAIGAVCDRVTIYRVLDRLIEEGKIHKIVNTDGVLKFANCATCDSTTHTHEHVHFSCERCKLVTCLPNINPSFKLPQSYKIHQVNFTIAGLCPTCNSHTPQ